MTSNEILDLVDPKVLATLNEEERNVLMTMLNEMVTEGESTTLNQLWEDDYDEIPVDIDTFIENDDYLGVATNQGRSIFPFWREQLREIFRPGAPYMECIGGDTIIPLLDGTRDTMEEVYNRIKYNGEKLWCYSVTESGEVVPGEITDARITGIREVFEVVLDNGGKFYCTDDHRLITRDGSEVMLKDVELGVTSIMPFSVHSNQSRRCTDECTHGRVVSMIPVGTDKVYDIQVDKWHNFAIGTIGPDYSCDGEVVQCCNNGIFVHNCVFSGAIGIGKTTIADIGLCYLLYKLLCLKNPQEYYGLTKSSIMTVAFINVDLNLAYGVSYAKMQSMLLESPWFLRHGTVAGSKSEVYVPSKGIEFRVGSSDTHVLGTDVFCMTGDTEVNTVEYGVTKLANLSGEILTFYQIDENGDVTISNPGSVIPTKEATELIELELEDGTVLRVTPEHKLMLSDGSYKCARDINVEDDLYHV